MRKLEKSQTRRINNLSQKGQRTVLSTIFGTLKKFKHEDLPDAKPGFRFEKIFVDEFFSVWTHEAIAEADKRGEGGPDDGGPKDGPRMKWAPP